MKQKSNPENREKILYQLVISAVFALAILVCVFTYLKNAKAGMRDNFEDMICKTAGSYAESMNASLEEVLDISDMTAEQLQTTGSVPGTTMKSAVSLGLVDHIYVVSKDGEGVDENGTGVSLSDEAYWADVNSTDKHQMLITPDGNGGKRIILISNMARNKTGKIIVSVPDPGMFDDIVGDLDLGANAVCMLTDKNGNVISVNDTASEFGTLVNLWEPEYKNSNDEAILKSAMASGTANSGYLTLGNEAKIFSISPVGNSKLSVVVAVSTEYMQRLYVTEYAAMRRMKTASIILVLMFVFLQFGVTFFFRIKDGQITKELEEKADTDLLTGLYNKLATERKIKEYISENPDTSCMLMLFDIDKFKKINDTQGHAFGDEVLRTLGETITAQFRVTDIIGRVGGDEFMVFLKNINGPEIEKKEAEKLVYYFKHFQAGTYVKYSATASVGVAVFPRDGADFETLYKAADSALYDSKENGRNQLTFHDGSIGPLYG